MKAVPEIWQDYPPGDKIEFVSSVWGTSFRLVFPKTMTRSEMERIALDERNKLRNIIVDTPALKPLLYKRSFC